MPAIASRSTRTATSPASIDKALNKELLSAPIRLAITTDVPRKYPAWNMDFDQEQAPPRAYVGGPAKIRIEENGPVRVSVEVTRETEDSRFVQTISLSAGDAGNRVEFGNAIDWRTAWLPTSRSLSPQRIESEGDLQLGRRHHPAAERARAAV